MTELIPLYIIALKNADWQDIYKFESSEIHSFSWLQEEGSLSRRLSEKCHELKVNLLNNIMIQSEALTDEECTLLADEPCLLREVILCGDGCEWVVGRTLIPESSVQNPPFDLSQQGDIPLGLTVFNADNVSRDQLQIAWIDTPGGKLVARRSRLWMNGKPLLVAELFLPDSPVYAQEKI